MTRPFTIDPGWSALLTDMAQRPADLLRKARLPEDLFARHRPVLDPDDYFRFWTVMSEALNAEPSALFLGRTLAAKNFSPPLFAALCSPNLTTALTRLSVYKPLVGPIRLEVNDTMGGLEVTMHAEDTTLPSEITVAELVSLVHTARRALGSNIRPIAVELVNLPTHPDYQVFFGRLLRKGPFDRVVFTREDAKSPFLSPETALFDQFEPDLRPRLDGLTPDASTFDRVRTVLMEALPSGQAEASMVAKRLGLSTRSLQRGLAAEGTGFKDELQTMRARLARHYLQGAYHHTSAEIAFLLGYEDPNSFIRAFHGWTGTTPEALRRDLNNEG